MKFFEIPMDHTAMMQAIYELSETYPFLSVSNIGESIFHRSIPMLTVGEGNPTVLLLGTQNGRDNHIPALLLSLMNEYSSLISSKKLYGNFLRWYESYSVSVIPMLNPDGVSLCLDGLSGDCLLHDRLLAMNGSNDFSLWIGNGRGVILDDNYLIDDTNAAVAGPCFCGVSSQSEPEVGSLCNYLRFRDDIACVLHLQGVWSPSRQKQKKNSEDPLVRCLARERCLSQTVSGFSFWCNTELGVPSADLALPKVNGDLLFSLYLQLRTTFLHLPLWIAGYRGRQK